jgi:hypothetical protein
MSFCWSFHLASLATTGPHWLDDPPDLSCKQNTRQHAVDGCPLSCKQPVPVPIRAPARTKALVKATVLCCALVKLGGHATLGAALVCAAGGDGIAVEDPDEADPAGERPRHRGGLGLFGLAGPAPGLKEAHHRRPPPQPVHRDRATVEGGHLERRGRLGLSCRQEARRGGTSPAASSRRSRGPPPWSPRQPLARARHHQGPCRSRQRPRPARRAARTGCAWPRILPGYPETAELPGPGRPRPHRENLVPARPGRPGCRGEPDARAVEGVDLE